MSTSFILPAVAPFRLDLTVWALRRTAANLIDRWDGIHYTRLFNLHEKLIKVEITQNNDIGNPGILVKTNKKISKTNQNTLSDLLIDMLGLSQDMSRFYYVANQDFHLKPVMMKFKGLKGPRFPSIFEAMCNAITCQQLSLEAGLQILNRFSQRYGQCIKYNKTHYCTFPRPQDIAKCNPKNLRELGFSLRKSETLIRIANSILEQENQWSNLIHLSDKEVIKYLCTIKGIGRWSAEYILLRGLGRIHFFPGDDIGAQRNLKNLLHFREVLDYAKTSKITSRWHPYAGLVYFHLLLQKLAEKKML